MTGRAFDTPGKGEGMEPSEDPKLVYADIIHHPHHRSENRAHMPLRDRAAQFSAYDALAGYYDMIAEEERTTDAAAEPDENARELLDRKLRAIEENLMTGERPVLSFTVFVPDERKEGGSYERRTESVRRIDRIKNRVVLDRREGRGGQYAFLEIERIAAIHGETVDQLDAHM